MIPEPIGIETSSGLPGLKSFCVSRARDKSVSIPISELSRKERAFWPSSLEVN